MIKARDRSGRVAVTFSLPAAVGARDAAVCGEWNGWSPQMDVMERTEGGFVRTVHLEAGRAYRFRYLLDGRRWANDWAADRYVPNVYGSDDSVVDLTAVPPIALATSPFVAAGSAPPAPVAGADTSPPEPPARASSSAVRTAA